MAVTYDNSAISAQTGSAVGAPLTQTWSQDVAGADLCGAIYVVNTNGGSASGVPAGTPTASIGGVALDYLGYELMGNSTIGGFVAAFAKVAAIPTGSGKSCTFSIPTHAGGFGNAFGISHTYNGVGSIGALVKANGVGSANALAVASAIDRLVTAAFGNFQSFDYSVQSYAERQHQEIVSPGLSTGDQAGASTTNLTATVTSGNHWAGVGFEMLPAGAGTPTNQFFCMF